MSGGHSCAVANCNNRSRKCRHSFFRFPPNIQRATIWAIACNREDLLEKVDRLHTSYRVCGVHFETRMFLNDLKNRLQPHAVPTIFSFSIEPPPHFVEHSYHQFIADQDASTSKQECDNVTAHLPLKQEDVISQGASATQNQRQHDKTLKMETKRVYVKVFNFNLDAPVQKIEILNDHCQPENDDECNKPERKKTEQLPDTEFDSLTIKEEDIIFEDNEITDSWMKEEIVSSDNDI